MAKNNKSSVAEILQNFLSEKLKKNLICKIFWKNHFQNTSQKILQKIKHCVRIRK